MRYLICAILIAIRLGHRILPYLVKIVKLYMENELLRAEISDFQANGVENQIEQVANQSEVKERYKGLFRIVYQQLPENERAALLADPINFISTKLFFRGLSLPKVKELLVNEIMKPESGDYNGTGVFTTDSPVGAIDFLQPDGALAVIDPDKLDYLEPEQGVHDIGSKEWKALAKEYLDKFSLEDRILEAYRVADQWDTKSTYSRGRPWHTIALRRPQPLGAVNKLIVFNGENSEPLALDPAVEQDKAMLKKIFSLDDNDKTI